MISVGLGAGFSKNPVTVLEGGAAALCEAPRGCYARGALGFSAQALGAVGLRGEVPWGSKSESTFCLILSPFRGYRSGVVQDISRGHLWGFE